MLNRVELDERGRPRMKEISSQGAVPLELWRQMRLDRRDAASMFEEIASVVRRFAAREKEESAAWIVHVATAERSGR